MIFSLKDLPQFVFERRNHRGKKKRNCQMTKSFRLRLMKKLVPEKGAIFDQEL